MIYVIGIPPNDRGLKWAVENTGMPLWFRNNFLPVLGASSEVFELGPVCQWEHGIPHGHYFFLFKIEWESWKRRGTSFGPHYISLVLCESKTLNKSLKKSGRSQGRSTVPGVRPKGSGDIVTSVPDLYLGCWELKWMVPTTRQDLLFSCVYVPLSHLLLQSFIIGRKTGRWY